MYKYKTVFIIATLQFDGHVLEYLRKYTEKLVALYLLPRGGGVSNLYEVYHRGVRVEKKDVYSPKKLFLAYLFYYIHFLRLLYCYFQSEEKLYFINSYWFYFFLRPVTRIFRNIHYVYWIGDYWPMDTLLAKIQTFFIHYYHGRNRICLYLSDRINRKMNKGTLVHTQYKKTSMWGIDPPNISIKKLSGNEITLCHIGVLVEWQGIDLLLAVVARDKRLRLKLIGTGNASLMAKYERLIKEYGITDRVYFPNKFFYGIDLRKQIKDCEIGMALYKVDTKSVTYYADPAKVKQYAEYGLPIIMTNAAGVADYITKFRAGIVVTRDIHSIQEAINKMKNNYELYLHGLNEFNKFFTFRTYYREIFKFMEEK